LRGFLRRERLASSELAIAEVPRALRRLGSERPGLPLKELLASAGRVLATVDLVALDRDLLILAGRFDDAYLRALDAIHIATALTVAEDLEWFVSYDRRQAEIARAAGLPLAQPGI